MILSKEDFLKPAARQVEPVQISKGTVYVRKLTLPEQIQLEAEQDVLDDGDSLGFVTVRLAFYLCTETGEPFVTLEEMRKGVVTMNADDAKAIASKGLELNKGLGAKAVEEAKGN
jgi:hypothetical protein